jgi:hypothetical protein
LRYPGYFYNSNDLFNKNTLAGKLFVSCLLLRVAMGIIAIMFFYLFKETSRQLNGNTEEDFVHVAN